MLDNPMHSGRPEDHPVDKPGGGLAANAEITANGTGMRAMRFFNTFRSINLVTKHRTIPPLTLTATRASTYASDIIYPGLNTSSTAPSYSDDTIGTSTTESVRTKKKASDEKKAELPSPSPPQQEEASSSSVPPTEQRERKGDEISSPSVPKCEESKASPEDEIPALSSSTPDISQEEPEREPGGEKRGRGEEEEVEKKSRKREKRETEEGVDAATESNGSKYSTVNGPEKDKKNKPIYTFGNYEAYYAGRTEDCRWLAMESKLGPYIANGNVLDIGCNTGKISAAVARSEHWPKSVLGVDVDEGLISKANARNWLENLQFKAQNFLRKEADVGEEYDVILCLSVVKWIHFQYGDHGVRRFFRKAYRKLRSGGIFVLESQDMKSYKKKRHLTPHIRENVRQIQLPPDDFPKFLESIGFELIDTIEPEKATAGFDRPIQFFKKKKEEKEAGDE